LIIIANVRSHPESIDTAFVAAVPSPFTTVTKQADETINDFAELTVWPEQALRTRISNLEIPLSEPFTRNPTAPIDSPVLAGCTRISTDPVALRNSAILFDTHGTINGWVDKRFPTPLTECEAPLQRLLRFEPSTFREHFTGATGGAVSLLDATVVGVGICHDVCHPEWASELVTKHAPTYLVTLASEQFDRRNIASDYLLRVTRLRALECGRTIVRCAGMGRPTRILPNGEFSTSTASSAVLFDVPEYNHMTTFASWGNGVVFLTTFIHLAITLMQLRCL
jgi:apolipoprotein N-acyltransferase